VTVILVVDGWFAYDAFFRDDPGSGAGVTAEATSPTYSGLRIVDDAGLFAGDVTINNPFDRDTFVIVTVDLYDGDQAVGELTGSVTLKADSQSSVELLGIDDFTAYTDARVHLSGWQI
jgi:hypothetical protein